MEIANDTYQRPNGGAEPRARYSNHGTQNASHNGDIARASTQVIAKRVALGMVAAVDPLRADHLEFARMVPEKIEAFSAAGRIMLTQSDQTNRQILRLARNEVITTVQATLEMTGCSGLASFAEMHGRLARAWFERAASTLITMGILVLTAQAAAMVPIQERFLPTLIG